MATTTGNIVMRSQSVSQRFIKYQPKAIAFKKYIKNKLRKERIEKSKLDFKINNLYIKDNLDYVSENDYDNIVSNYYLDLLKTDKFNRVNVIYDKFVNFKSNLSIFNDISNIDYKYEEAMIVRHGLALGDEYHRQNIILRTKLYKSKSKLNYNIKNNFTFKNSLNYIGLLNGAKVFGPLTKKMYYVRLGIKKINLINKYHNNRLRSCNLRIKHSNLISKLNIKPVPNINCKNTSIKQIKIKSYIPDSAPIRHIFTNNYVYQRSRNVDLLNKLRIRIYNLRLSKYRSKLFNLLFQHVQYIDPQGSLCSKCFDTVSDTESVVERIDDLVCEVEDQHASHECVNCRAFWILFDVKYGYPNEDGCNKECPSCRKWTNVLKTYDSCIECYSKWQCWDCVMILPHHLQAQMDKEDEVAETIRSESKFDTTIIEQRDASCDDGPIFTENSWNMLTTTQQARQLPEATDRELPVYHDTWQTNHNRHQVLVRKALPLDCLRDNFNSPISLLFKQHRYWKGDLEVTLHVNSNEAMVGQLMMCFFYGADSDDSFQYRQNCYTASTMMHCLVSAGSSNPGKLVIPYAHIYPYLTTVQRNHDHTFLNLGKLFVVVINPLQALSTVGNSAEYYITLSLQNCQFVGQVDMHFGLQSQMDPWTAVLATTAAEKLLTSSFADQNRDNPPVQVVPQPVQLMTAGQLSFGTGVVEPTNAMRLNPRGQTTYFGLDKKEMLITDFTRRFGLAHILKWNQSDSYGTKLGHWGASPIWPRTDYHMVNANDKAFRCLPPVAYIASCFKQFRGTMEYRFDVVCNHFYSGSLMVAYIPGVNSKDVTIDMAKNSHYAIFSIQENRQFTFTVPYITDRPWWPRPYADGNATWDFSFPGGVYLFVMNKLIPNSLVPNSIEINMYVRGGEDLEFSVPVTPCISSILYPYYTSPKSGVRAAEGYYPYYVGTSRYFYDNKYALLRYGSFNDHLVYFDKLDLNRYYVLKEDSNVYLRYKDSSGNWVQSGDMVKYGVAFKDPNQEWGYWMAIVRSELYAQRLVSARSKKESYDQYWLEYPNDDKDTFLSGNPEWDEKLATKEKVIYDSESWVDLCPQIDEKFDTKVKITSEVLTGTSFGLTTFGEDFSKLTNILRRYQYVMKKNIAPDTQFMLRVEPYGMVPFDNADDVYKFYGREGFPGLIAPSYRFFRGSIRIKIICHMSYNYGGMLYIQHRPDVFKVTEENIDFYSPQGYATFAQQIDTNRIITVEIPYYLDSVYGFLVTKMPEHKSGNDISRCSNLGVILIKYINKSNRSNDIEIYQSLGDDAKFELYQGVLPVKFLETQILKADPQGDEDEILPHGSVFSTISETQKDLKKIGDSSEKVSGFIAKVDSLWDSSMLKYNKFLNFMNKDKFILIMSQFAHMLVSPHLPTIAIGIGSIILGILNLDFSWLSKIQTSITKFLGQLDSSEPSKGLDAQGSSECPTGTIEFMGVIASLVAAVLGVKFFPSNNYYKSLLGLFSGCFIISRGIEGITKLINSILMCTGRLFKYYLYRNNGVYDIHSLLADHSKDMIGWAKHVQMDLLDSEKDSEHDMDPNYPQLVFDAYLQGTIYSAQLTSCSNSSNAFQLVKMFTERLKERRDKLVKQGKHPFTRFTPFSLWITGVAGVGKSSMTTNLVSKCFQKAGVTCRGNPISKWEITNDHQDNITADTKVIVIDDAGAVRSPEITGKMLNAYYCIVNCQPFTPPMAHLENKWLQLQNLMLISTSNFAYLDSSEIADKAAFHRRRHQMWRVKWNPKFLERFRLRPADNGEVNMMHNCYQSCKGECVCPQLFVGGNLNTSILTEEERLNREWMLLDMYADPRSPDQSQNFSIKNLTYSQFLERISDSFTNYYKSEVSAYHQRVKDLMTLCEPALEEIRQEPDVVTVKETKDKFYSKLFKTISDKAESVNKKFKDFVLKDNPNVIKFSHPKSVNPVVEAQNYDERILEFLTEEDKNNLKEYGNIIETLRNQIYKAPVEVTPSIPEKFKDFFKQRHDHDDVDMVYKMNPKHLEPFNEKFSWDKIMEVYVQLLDGKKVSDSDLTAAFEVVRLWESCQLKTGETCAHNKCGCNTLYEVGGVEYCVPTCSKCLADDAIRPITATFCKQKCAFYSVVTCPLNFLKAKCVLAAQKLRRFVLAFSRCLFNALAKNSKSIIKGMYSASIWAIKKICSFTYKVVLPLIGIYFVGSALAIYKWGPEKYGETIGKGMCKTLQFCDNTYNKMKRLVCPQTGEEFLVPEGSVYSGASKVAGVGTNSVKQMVAKALIPHNSVDVILTDRHYINDIIKKVNDNTYTVCALYTDSDGKQRIAKSRGMFLRGRQFLTTTHCWLECIDRKINKGAKLYLTKAPSFMLEIDESKCELHRFQDSNLCVIQFPTKFNQHKNIVKYIPTIAQHQKITNNGCLVVNNESALVYNVNMKYVNDIMTVKPTQNHEAVAMAGSYRYDIGAPGMCGSFLICTDTNPCLIGMHVAGLGTKAGYSEPLIREMFEEVKPSPRDVSDVQSMDLLPIDLSRINIDCNVLQLGVVEPQLAHHESGQSSIVPSLVHGIFPVKTEPAPLMIGDPRLPENCSPLAEGVKKSANPILGFPLEYRTFAKESLKQILRTQVKPVIGTDKVSLQEAICGRPGVFTSINFHSSAGFPFSSFRPSGMSGKEWLFDLELGQDGYILRGIDRRLINIMRLKKTLRANDIRPLTVFTDCLKDARIAREKCTIPGKTRLFSVAPVDYTIQYREYFLPYLVAHQQSRSEFTTAVGINIHGPEWTDMVKQMVALSPFQLDGDYSNFGNGFCAEIHDDVQECKLDWFDYHGQSDEDRQQRKILLTETQGVVHLVLNLMYQTCSGMPSGSPETVETNDLVNLMYILMAWYDIMQPYLYHTLNYFLKYVKIKTYGDDIWLSVHPHVIDAFNNVSLNAFFARHGVKYTSADKTGEITPYKNILDISFLKCKPVPHPVREGMFLAQLDLNSALDIANWCWKSKDLKQSTIVNLEACADALYGHGPEIHEHYRQILMREANRLGFIGNFRSWIELDYIFLSGKDKTLPIMSTKDDMRPESGTLNNETPDGGNMHSDEEGYNSEKTIVTLSEM